MRLELRVVGPVVMGAVLAVQRWVRPAPALNLSAQEALLSRQHDELVKLAAAAESGTLLDFRGVLVVVDQVLVRDLLRAVMPLEADVGGGFRVRVDSADAVFGDGVALVNLTGAAMVGGSSVGSAVTVSGALDVVRLDTASGVLQCGVSILGVEATDAKALGRNDPVRRLTEALAQGGLSLLLGTLEIPVSVENRLLIPPVESKRLHIAGEALSLTLAVQQVKVFSGRLWIFVDAALSAEKGESEAKG